MESDSDSEHFCLLMDTTWTPSPQQLPPVVPRSGLSLERQWYLHNHIREYCPEEVRDEVCPRPLAPLSSNTPAGVPSSSCSSTAVVSSIVGGSSAAAGSSAVTAGPSTAAGHSINTVPPTSVGSLPDDPPLQPPTKQARVCSKCHMAGHNARTCGK